ncbi:hypothetical protein AVT69_gp053 [Pseudomonas phage PhiPA3]|uniref:Uncharacterized protein 052 n=1 Tax=Pseudomonas phage PhiPA3 TaxID=998086 RepID=F8SJT4_BPPA3|nr:hypothetical protein AVT69_gp053 [Pseudomonas phage PhiPA3]AEH03479.1 hypothetical protein [Pseudomonas phage PhiPA3]
MPNMYNQVSELFLYSTYFHGMDLTRCNRDAVEWFMTHLADAVQHDFDNLDGEQLDDRIKARIAGLQDVIQQALTGEGVLCEQPGAIKVEVNGIHRFIQMNHDFNRVKMAVQKLITGAIGVIRPGVTTHQVRDLEKVLSKEWTVMTNSARKEALVNYIALLANCHNNSQTNQLLPEAKVPQRIFLNPRNRSTIMQHDDENIRSGTSDSFEDTNNERTGLPRLNERLRSNRATKVDITDAPDLTDARYSDNGDIHLKKIFLNISATAIAKAGLLIENFTDDNFDRIVNHAASLFGPCLDTNSEELINNQLSILATFVRDVYDEQTKSTGEPRELSLIERKFSGNIPLDIDKGYLSIQRNDTESSDQIGFVYNDENREFTKASSEEEQRMRDEIVAICSGPSIDALHHKAALDYQRAIQEANDVRAEGSNTSHMKYKQLMQKARAHYLQTVEMIDKGVMVENDGLLATNVINARTRLAAYRCNGNELVKLHREVVERRDALQAAEECRLTQERGELIRDIMEKVISRIMDAQRQGELTEIVRNLIDELNVHAK